jgi:hypothetical protein
VGRADVPAEGDRPIPRSDGEDAVDPASLRGQTGRKKESEVEGKNPGLLHE